MVNLPHATRSQVFQALFNLIVKIPPPVGKTWNTQSQHLVDWDQVPGDKQPAIFLHRGPQTLSQKTFGVTKLQLRASIWIYYSVAGLKTSSTYPDQLTDPFLDTIELTFQTDPLNGRLTLGTYVDPTTGRTEPLVYHCWVDGTIYCDPGLTDDQAFIIVPISILL
jgi:hypothetical protein